MAKKSLQKRLVQSMVKTVAIVAGASLAAVAVAQYFSTQRSLEDIEERIRTSLLRRGRMMSESQALTLRGLASDNAFGDITNIVSKAVGEDSDVVYGLFLGEDGSPWTYVSPSTEAGTDFREAFAELGIDAEAVDEEKLAQRTVELFGQEILEFSAPVRDEDYYLGSIRYGLSTASMRAAVAKARRDGLIASLSTMGLMLGATLAAMGFGIMRSRQEAAEIAEPIGSLTHAAEKLAGGDRTVAVHVFSGDEIETLADAFNAMVADLKKSYDSLEELNRGLEDKVAARTSELAARNKEMAVVLENVAQGLVTIDPNGKMSTERSAAFDSWLGAPPSSMMLQEHLGSFDANLAVWFDLGLDSVRDGIMPLEVCLTQLPQRARAGERDLQFGYTAIPGEEPDSCTGILVTISDITAELAREKADMEQREIMEIFRRMSKDPSGFMDFWTDADHLVDRIAGPEEGREQDATVLARVVHTLKGNAGIYGLKTVAEICHHIEDEMAQEGAPTEPQLELLLQRWGELRGTVMELSSEAAVESTVTASELDRLIEQLEAGASVPRAIRILNSWKLEPAHLSLERLGDKASDLAERLEKTPLDIQVEAGDVRIPPEKWKSFFSELIHVIRNAVDHGLEGPEARKEAGKDPTGHLRLAIRDDDQAFAVIVADDGKGIDWDAVARKASKMQMPSESKADLVNALFADGMSTRETVSDTSGRGVGMSAVKEIVHQMGGRIRVESETGRGTRFYFEFPPTPATYRGLWDPTQDLTRHHAESA